MKYLNLTLTITCTATAALNVAVLTTFGWSTRTAVIVLINAVGMIWNGMEFWRRING